jgi:folate-binding protein YgfZ
VAERRWLVLERDVVVVRGPESGAYLQGQLSQDVAGLGEGGHAWSWLLAPTGKVDALVRVGRLGPEEWALDTDAGWGRAVAERLQRFRLRTKAEISIAEEASVVGLRGDGWQQAPPRGADLVAAPPWPGVAGADLVVLGGGLPELPAEERTDPAGYEPERIAAGIPRMGAELDERTIPGETGLVPLTVSFTKGCYTGQELVARIDSRGGNVPRHLRRLRIDGPVAAGSELFDADRSAGVITSAAESPGLGWVGLGYVKRAWQPPVRLRAGPDGPGVEVLA